jgi:predicted RNA-binding Zn-ribbon protein involved in translation (DUF1610 family)
MQSSSTLFIDISSKNPLSMHIYRIMNKTIRGIFMIMRYDSYCGLYCGACDVLQANEEGRIEELAKEWDIDPDDIVCHGCKTEISSVYCRTCDIKKCAEDKKVEFCFQCSEYPCPLLVEFRTDECSHHSVVLKNLGMIKEKGVLTWLGEQEKRWSCPECGTAFTWYNKTCRMCGKVLYNCEDEEVDIEAQEAK